MKRIFFITIIFLLINPLSAKLKFPTIISDNMVLQQQTNVNLWGWTDSRKKVSVNTSWNKETQIAAISSEGEWQLAVPTPIAGGPYSITISDGEESITLHNILIGEVWLCSGQSNMEMPMKGFRGQPVENAIDAIANASPEDNIRMVTLKTNSSQTLLKDCIATPWLDSTPENVADFSATAYFFAKYLHKVLKVPVGVVCSSWGGSRIESWINKEVFMNKFPEISLDVLLKNPKDIARPKDEPILLYNAMIHPIERFTIKGTIWYQGEANRDNPEKYKRLFPAMVESWRKERKQGNFPFYYVQIAPYDYGKDNADKTDAAEMRQVQLECMKIIPNSGMVVTADVGERSCIHPEKKEIVGKRLALWALSQTYSRSGIPYSGPIYKSHQLDKNEVIVNFEYAEMGMTSYGKEIIGFEVAGKDGAFYPAIANLFDNKTKIKLVSKHVIEPIAVRYGYRNYMSLNLFSNFGLPASPFVINK